MVRLMKYVEFMKKVVPLHDDLFDFFYEALPGYEKVGQRRILLGCWGSFQDPEVCDYTTRTWISGARPCMSRPGVVVDGQLGDQQSGGHQSRHSHSSRQFLLRRLGKRGNVRYERSARQSGGQRHPWNQTTTPRPQKRDFKGNYSWVMSPRWYDKRTGDYLALDTGGGPIARFWATALAGIVDIGYIKATGHSVKIYLPKTASLPGDGIRMEDSEVEQRD